MNDHEFRGRVALVTGGSRGIGRAIALKLARHGADVAINYLSRDPEAEEARRLVEAEGVRCVLAKADVSDPDSVAGMAARVRDELGPIGLLVANAGFSVLESHDQVTWESWKKTMSINLDGVFLSVMAVKDEMLANRWGRIVCISSVAALRPRKMQIHYASSKAALSALTRCCAEAFAPHVRVNCIAPGLIETEMGALLGPAATGKIISETPLGRLGTPEEIANAAYFFLSDLSSFMTGQTIAVSGGRVMLP
ncbi:MAG: SDR family NAD(P)-dependent oxidoreductase [Bryobacteraceae bacterium]